MTHSDRTPGQVALIALARLDELTLRSDWKNTRSIGRRIRLIINEANNDIKQIIRANEVDEEPYEGKAGGD